ncbi:MAG: tetratricopeptide repeat protein, partial [Acidobacteriaceae bacterium]|nr:tetratricopeptide repeat protein [Acidobacteriaceae bacterium]
MGKRSQKHAAKPAPNRATPNLAYIGAGLFFLVLVVFWRVADNGFVNFDDDIYVYANEHVRDGLSLDNLRWAFTSVNYIYYQPLTWLSHMLDVELFGLKPGGHHLMSVLIHALSSVGLLLWLARSTGRVWCAAFAAGLFALHPLRVESVAWAAERKDVLSTFFLIVALVCYTRYVNTRTGRWYAAVLGALLCGLLSKPMLVAAPFLFLLVDYWPLARNENVMVLLREKIPMFVLAAISSVLTYLGQEKSGAIAVLRDLTVGQRLANATVSYLRYLVKMLWPDPLTVLYPYDRSLPVWAVAGALGVLAALSALSIFARRRYPFAFFGWWWYVVALLPVIGIVQAGFQSFADRFSYIPSIGIFVAVVWGAALVAQNWPSGWKVASAAGVGALFILSVVSYQQIAYWHDGVALFRHAVDRTSHNYLAEHNLGFALEEAGQSHEAVPHLLKAVSLEPGSYQGHYNLGKALAADGEMQRSIASFTKAIEAKPNYAEAYYARATMYQKAGDRERAIADYQKALSFASLGATYQAEAYNNLGVYAAQAGRPAEAYQDFSQSVA